MTDLIIRNDWALGDTICLSALVRDIHLAHPGRYRLHMAGHYQSYWRHCPHAKAMVGDPGGRVIRPQYRDGIREAGRGLRRHFITWFHTDFKKKIGVEIPITRPKGELYISPERLNKPAFPFRYWVVMAGCKADMPVKQWDVRGWQTVVDELLRNGIRCVQGGADFDRHFHPRLKNVIQAVGKTDDINDFLAMIHHSEGVLCGITAAMHAAAAADKPCVVVAGGREEVPWEAYTNSGQWPIGCEQVKIQHKFLHTIGLLDCCEKKGCWKDRVVPLDSDDHTNAKKRSQLCKYPLRLSYQSVPQCMDMIKPEKVVQAVLSYYDEGILPKP